jgi:hypothetical protein
VGRASLVLCACSTLEAGSRTTVHSFSLRPTSLLERAIANGWKVAYFETYEGPVQRSVRERMGIVGWRWKLAISMTRLLTFGFLSADETGIITVLTKLPY